MGSDRERNLLMNLGALDLAVDDAVGSLPDDLRKIATSCCDGLRECERLRGPVAVVGDGTVDGDDVEAAATSTAGGALEEGAGASRRARFVSGDRVEKVRFDESKNTFRNWSSWSISCFSFWLLTCEFMMI